MQNVKKFSTVITLSTALLMGQLGLATAANATTTTLDTCSATAFNAAVNDANGNPGDDVISLTADCHATPIMLDSTVELSAGGGLTILGAGANKTVIKRGFDDRAAGDTFVDGGITYTTANAPMIDASALGSTETLTLSGLTLDGNGAEFVGRAIEIDSDANLTVSMSEINNNNANELCSDATTCVIAAEDAADTNADLVDDAYTGESNGAAILVAGSGATSVEHSTLTGNQTTLSGAAIYVDGSLELSNSTFEGNTSVSNSGSDVATGNTSLVSLVNNTFLGAEGNPSAIYSESDAVTTVGNLYVNVTCQLTGTDNGYASTNIAASSSSCLGATVSTVAALRIQPLEINSTHPSNSGAVRTAALLEGSSAINHYAAASISAGNQNLVLTDERGVPRLTPAAGNLVDAGAFEYIADNADVVTAAVPTYSNPYVAGTATLEGTVDTHGLAASEFGFYLTKSTTPVTSCGVADATTDKISGTAVVAEFTDSTVDPATRMPVDIHTDLSALSSNADYYYCAYAVTGASDAEMYGEVMKYTSAPNHLNLNLKLATGSLLRGAKAYVSGSGLMPLSTLSLYQYSTRKLVKTFPVDMYGNFGGYFRVTSCAKTGEHKFVAEGMAPDSAPVTDAVYFVIDPNCKVQAMSGAKLGTASITVTNVLFANYSSKLQNKYKAMLAAWLPLFKSSKTITIHGYTETNQPSKSALKACIKLSKQRALAVEKYLRSKGIHVHFIIKGHGATSPVSKKQAKNRRATVKFPVTYGH